MKFREAQFDGGKSSAGKARKKTAKKLQARQKKKLRPETKPDPEQREGRYEVAFNLDTT